MVEVSLPTVCGGCAIDDGNVCGGHDVDDGGVCGCDKAIGAVSRLWLWWLVILTSTLMSTLRLGFVMIMVVAQW